MKPVTTDQQFHSPGPRDFGGVGEGSVRRTIRGLRHAARATSRPLPGLGAYRNGCEGARKGRALPGFQARSYRDSGHRPVHGRDYRATGISGMSLPGSGAQRYRETSQGGAGTWGTNEPAATGISGMGRGPNRPTPLPFPAINSVSSNSCNNTSTTGAHFRFGGRGR